MASQAIEQVQESGLPEELPGQAELGVGAAYLGASYEAAWLATRELARAGGEDALVELYRAAGAGEDVDDAMLKVVGLSRDELVERWRDVLSALAGEADAA